MTFQHPTELNKGVTSLFMLQLNNIVFISLSVRRCVFSCLQKLNCIWQAQSCVFISVEVVCCDTRYKTTIAS
jgi:energy-coupling factor transporter transmembrane protein EcfT